MLLRLTDRGLYCEAGDFFVDPWGAVDRAVVTHAHGDHVAWGCRAYLTSSEGLGVLRSRLAPEARVSGLPWGEPATIRGVRVSFHPAGHILGSAQIRLELGGEVWVVSGDYKTDPDPTTTPFEPVRCHTFVTESTFGLPIYRWPPQQDVLGEINDWWRANQAAGKASLLYGYALGKAQRLIAGLDPGIGPIFTHGAVERMTAVYRAAGVSLPPTTHAGAVDRRTDWSRAIIVAPPSAERLGVDPAVRTPVHRLRLGLDAGPRHAAAAIARSRLPALGSRGLAGPHGRCRGHRRRAGVGHPRVHRARGALAPRAGARRAGGADPVRRRAG